jgi:hypothetical protein
LLFTNFTFTPAGVGTPNAGAVGYTLDNPGLGIGGDSIWGFEFNPGLSVVGTAANPNAIQDILLTYLVVPTGTQITSIHLLQNAAATNGGIGQVSENLTFCIASDPNNTSGVCRSFGGNPLLVSTAGVNHEEVRVANWTSMMVSKDINVASVNVGGTATISQVRDAVDLTIPEPGTYGMISIGLFALGYFSRRRRV